MSGNAGIPMLAPNMHNDPYSDRQVAVVAGAASGIGRAFVLRLLRRGDACVAADLDRAGLASLAEEAMSAAEWLKELRCTTGFQ